MKKKQLIKYTSVYGIWRVTTEDINGEIIKNLGNHKGWIDEIALFLKDKCCYSLTFMRIKKL